jgi:hypothetical protein
MAGPYTKNGPSKTDLEAIRLETYGKETSRKTKTAMARDVMEDLKKLNIENWKEAVKDRRTWRDLAEKAKTHEGL